MARVLGIDYGLARIGVSISDERKIVATSLKTLTGWKDSASVIQELKNSTPHTIEKIVIGYPLLMNGKESDMCKQIQVFAEKLKEVFPIPVVFWDERLTSSQAERALKEMNLNRKKRAGAMDAVAAILILQSYLDSNGPSFS